MAGEGRNLLANSPKNDLPVSAENFTLYYFPEIPAGGEKTGKAKRDRATFISGTNNGQRYRDDRNQHGQESPQVQAAIEEAFNRGLEQGRAEIRAAYQESVDGSVSAFRAAVEEMIRIHRCDLATMETETVKLALSIARQIIGGQTQDAQVVRHVVKKAMQKVSDPRELTIRINPEDIETVTAMKAELTISDDPDMAFQIQPDDTIGRGGCIIETRLGDVDARIEQQICIIESLLTTELAASTPES